VSESRRRLEQAGYTLEPSRAGKHFWREPGTGRRVLEDRAIEAVWREEARQLEEWGWVRVEVEGDTFWRRPRSGHLYPRGAAYDVLMRMVRRMEGEGQR
jgi:hypothetical protein